MNTTAFSFSALRSRPPAAARMALAQLARIRGGTLTLRLPDGEVRLFGDGPPAAAMTLHNWSVFGAVASGGDVGLGESYMAGDWSTPSLPELLSLLVRNREPLQDFVYGRLLARVAQRLRHLFHRNTRGGSQRNISAHYDLGNDFYRLWLDEGMNYSSAIFSSPDQSLASAQEAKMLRTLQMAGVGPDTRMLEIGIGWGALAEMAGRFGAQVTGVTLSREQLDFAQARMTAAGIHADLRLQDYRDLRDDAFDAICSIEMVEAVGREYWPQYFGTVARLLKPGGRACIQTIVMADALWPAYIRGSDFIQQYIFPGGCLPSGTEFERHARAAGLEVVQEFRFGADYARTLAHWRERFAAERAGVARLGFDERFLRMWEFYLAYCEAAFVQGNTDVVQYTLQKPAGPRT